MRDTALGLGMGERMALIPALDDPKDLFSLLRQPTLASHLQHLPEMAEAGGKSQRSMQALMPAA